MTMTSEQKQRLDDTIAVLKDIYIENLIYVQEQVKAEAPEEELKQIDELILANERMIIYLDQSDTWVRNLHAEARGEAVDGELVDPNDTGDEFDKLENAGDFSGDK